MRGSSAFAIYTLFWVMSFFLVLPFRLRSGDEPEARVAGQADSAPPRFSLWRTIGWATIVSMVLFGLFYVNYLFGWVGPGAFDLFTQRRPI